MSQSWYHNFAEKWAGITATSPFRRLWYLYKSSLLNHLIVCLTFFYIDIVSQFWVSHQYEWKCLWRVCFIELKLQLWFAAFSAKMTITRLLSSFSNLDFLWKIKTVKCSLLQSILLSSFVFLFAWSHLYFLRCSSSNIQWSDSKAMLVYQLLRFTFNRLISSLVPVPICASRPLSMYSIFLQ